MYHPKWEIWPIINYIYFLLWINVVWIEYGVLFDDRPSQWLDINSAGHPVWRPTRPITCHNPGCVHTTLRTHPGLCAQMDSFSLGGWFGGLLHLVLSFPAEEKSALSCWNAAENGFSLDGQTQIGSLNIFSHQMRFWCWVTEIYFDRFFYCRQWPCWCGREYDFDFSSICFWSCSFCLQCSLSKVWLNVLYWPLTPQVSQWVSSVNGSSDVLGYALWKPVAYRQARPAMEDATPCRHSVPRAQSGSMVTASSGLIRGFFSDPKSMALNVSFGLAGEPFYNVTRFLSW